MRPSTVKWAVETYKRPVQQIWGAIDFHPFSGRKSKSGDIHPSLSIHHLPSLSVPLPSVHGDLNLFTSTCSFPARHLPHPLPRSLFLSLQSVPGSKCVYVPLSACLYSDGNAPNVFLFQGILCLSYLPLNQKRKVQLWSYAGHGHASLTSFLCHSHTNTNV